MTARDTTGGIGGDDDAALPARLRRPIGIAALVSALVVSLLAVSYAGDGSAGAVDMWIQGAFAQLLPPRGQAALAVDFVGEPVGAVVLTVVVATACLALGRRRLAVVAVVGPIATGVVTTVLKPVVDRTINGPHLAFPSGHTAFVTAVALVVGLLAVVQLRTGVAYGTLIVAGAVCIAGGAMTWAQVVPDRTLPDRHRRRPLYRGGRRPRGRLRRRQHASPRLA